MNTRTRFVMGMLCAAALGCSADGTVGVREIATGDLEGGGGASACHSIQVLGQFTGAFPNFSGALSGDVVGTSAVTLQFDGLTGVVIHLPGTAVWQVSSSSVPGLARGTLLWEFESIAVRAPGQAAPDFRVNNTMRLVSGAQSGNVTAHRAAGSGDTEYHGVICI